MFVLVYSERFEFVTRGRDSLGGGVEGLLRVYNNGIMEITHALQLSVENEKAMTRSKKNSVAPTQTK